MPMLSDVKLPEALVLLVADRADRVASVDAGVQDEPMLRETAVPAVQVRPELAQVEVADTVSGISNAVEPTQNFSACSAVFFAAVRDATKVPLSTTSVLNEYCCPPTVKLLDVSCELH